MTQTFIIIIFLSAIFVAEFVPAFACSFDNSGRIMASGQRGIVTGKVTDSQGNPLEGVKIIIDHGLFFNTNLVTSTGADGRYRIRVPDGAWFAFAQISKTYSGKNYTFYLKPDNSDSFGGEGAIRDFVWVLTGKREKPLADGFFGGTITFDENPRSRTVADTDDIEFTLMPVGALIDGSVGKVLKLRGQNNDRRLRDIPIGRYDITATYQGEALRLRKWGTQEEFAEKIRMDFEPSGSDCFDCIELQYLY